MPKYTFIFILLLSASARSQDSTLAITSFFLTDIPVQNAELLDKVPQEFENAYLLDSDSLSTLYVWQDSIVLKKTLLFTLSMTEIIDNPDWYLLNGKLHGVKKGIGLTFVEDNDTIVAALEIDYPIWTSMARNETVYKTNNQIRIFQRTDNYWMFYLINLSEQDIEISNFDHDPVIATIQAWTNTTETMINGYKTYLSNPSRKEFETLLNDDKAFENKKTYTAISTLD